MKATIGNVALEGSAEEIAAVLRGLRKEKTATTTKKPEAKAQSTKATHKRRKPHVKGAVNKGARWTDLEEVKLRDLYNKGVSVRAIAKELKRPLTAIDSRLQVIRGKGLVKDYRRRNHKGEKGGAV